MKAYLILISIVFNILAAKAEIDTNSFLPSVDGEKKEYNSVIQFKSNTLTGICIIKKEEGEILGTFINEFGIKGFDFIYNIKKNNIKIVNAIKFLNKWYIKKTIKKDLKFLIVNKTNSKNKKREVNYDDGCIMLMNNKYEIIYKFKPINK